MASQKCRDGNTVRKSSVINSPNIKWIKTLQIKLFQGLITIPNLLALILDLKYCSINKTGFIVHKTRERRFNL